MSRPSAFVGWLLLTAAGAAAAQSPAPPQPPERKAPSGSSLNLKLDEADLRALSRNAPVSRDQPAEQRTADLPSLGGGARAMEHAPRPIERTSPFPQNTNPGY
jgi:hypothetical protein